MTATQGVTLDTAELVRTARRTRPPGHGLWDHLRATAAAQMSPAELEAALASRFSIRPAPENLGANQVTGIERGADGLEIAGIWVALSEGPALVCDDPWSAPAMVAFSRRPHACLLLARTGQVALITQAPPRETPAVQAGVAARPPAGQQDASEQDSDVIRFVDAAIAKAWRDGASDIHFETSRSGVSLKFRIDGVMVAGDRFADTAHAEEVISRIKVMGQLDITERRRPQDGRIHWKAEGGDTLDLRVSIMPSIFGEDAVLRLLDKTQLRDATSSITLDGLGFDEVLAARIRSLASRPHGMLLVTGPTGSGKTTTVYAALSEVNDGLEKIITIEDPVEYELAGVLQIPVNEQKGLTFATGLRSILRHDPDRILVGEIRDAETAEIAVQSSLTGHLVMTTVHANSLFDVLGRFQHFDIDPFGLASALNGIVVQRLLRRLCTHCVSWRTLKEGEAQIFQACGLPAPQQLPAAGGCEHCRNSGYRGRMVVAEVHELTDRHRDLIIRRASLSELRQELHAGDAVTLLSRALQQAVAGTTSLEEIRRVVGLA